MPKCAGHLRLDAAEKVKALLIERSEIDLEGLTARLIEAGDLDSLDTAELAVLLTHLSQKRVTTDLSAAIVNGPGPLAGHAA